MTSSGTFGERLRKERERMGLTQAAMAEIGGVKRTTQHIYETDIRVPDLHYLRKVEEAGCDLYFLMFGSFQPSERSDAITPSTLSNIYRVVDEFCIDSRGRPLPLESRVRFFQLLCASVKAQGGKDAGLEALRGELSQFVGT
ncbi:helix-turn-helix domain-containing protein [Comamonas testosteroni]|uniref:helix-turn-helix domain-containing protein n=1 Tax=Comamonas testosteroni TaxID=285 RepID=UPI00391A2C8E